MDDEAVRQEGLKAIVAANPVNMMLIGSSDDRVEIALGNFRSTNVEGADKHVTSIWHAAISIDVSFARAMIRDIEKHLQTIHE
jgi:hypothetical protein